MSRIYSFAIFLSIVLLLSFAMNFYVLSRLCRLFRIKKGLVFWTVVFICTISLIGASIFQSYVGNVLSRITYILAANWYGILWLLFSSLIIYEVVRVFIKTNPFVAGVLILIIVALASVYSIVNAQLVKIRRQSIPGNVNANIVQLSDIHIGSVSGKFLQRIIEQTNNLNPDLVLITGDLVDNYNKTTQEAIGLLDGLTAPVFFVNGNHEEYAGPARIAKSLNAANVTVLNNRQIDYDGIQIIGIDNNVRKKDLEQVLQKININEANFSILMCHRPVELKTLSQTGLDLVLSGHTHSGQIFPFNYIVKLFYKPSSGLHKYNNTYQYITSGTGTWGPRMRLGSRSEIVLLEIRKEIIDSPK